MKAAALIVTTQELARDMSAAASAFITAELRGAVSTVVDETFFNSIITTATPSFTSSGTSADAMRADLNAMLLSVNSGATSRLFWIFGVDAAKRASVMPDTGGAMSAAGGELLNLPAVISDAVNPDEMVLLDASAFVANVDRIQLNVSREADIAMVDNPSMRSDTPTGGQMTSMFQTDSVALLAEVSFGFEQIRDAPLPCSTAFPGAGCSHDHHQGYPRDCRSSGRPTSVRQSEGPADNVRAT